MCVRARAARRKDRSDGRPAHLTEDPIGAALNGPAGRSADGTAETVLGGLPAGPAYPGQPGGRASPLVAVVADLSFRVTDWMAGRSLTATSVSGIAIALAICAAGWFSAGTTPGNINGVLALAAGYLVVLAARRLAGPAGLAGSGLTAAADRADLRPAWQAGLGVRIFEYACYAGLTAGAAAQFGSDMWPLGITVLSLVSIHDTMTACSAPARLARAAAAGRPAVENRDGPTSRAALAVLTMPVGGRVLLIVVVAPLWGARAVLVGLLDWAIIAIGIGIVLGSWRGRGGPAREDASPTSADARPAPAEPGGLAILLQPTRPPLPAESPVMGQSRAPISVLHMELTGPPTATARDTQDLWLSYTGTGTGTGTDSDAGTGTGTGSGSDAGTGTGSGSGTDIDTGTDSDTDTDTDTDTDPSLAAVTGGPAGWDYDPGDYDGDDYDNAGHAPSGGIRLPAALAVIQRCRDDGVISRWVGGLVRGQLTPLPPALVALTAVAVLAHLGLRDLPGFLLLAPPIMMLVAAPGSSHWHDGQLDWLVPAVLMGAQYIYIAALGFASGVPVAVTFLLGTVVAVWYADLGSAASPRAGSTGPASTGFWRTDWLGWEGRMLVCGLGAAMGVATLTYLALAAYLAVLLSSKVVTGYCGSREGDCQ